MHSLALCAVCAGAGSLRPFPMLHSFASALSLKFPVSVTVSLSHLPDNHDFLWVCVYVLVCTSMYVLVCFCVRESVCVCVGGCVCVCMCVYVYVCVLA